VREIREINRGGYGVVHEVLVGRQHLARKTFNPITPDEDLREKLKKRFKREVRIQSKIHHPNIMPVLDSDLDAVVPWFTMPLASESFEQKIIRDRSQGLVDIAAWQDILAAVEELHRLGYVHRDLKPQNLLWLDDKWTLADFGLILPVARDTTIISSSHSAYGSHFYAAPEQLTDFRNAPEQADIFALGCVLHDNVESTPSRIPFAQIRSSGPYAVILEKCTEFDPRRRFPKVAALRSALFDQWRISQLEQPIADDADVLKDVLSSPTDADAWRRFLAHVEGLQARDRHILLSSVNADVLMELKGLDDILFTRMMNLISEWVEGTGFDFNFCDVIGDRLVTTYGVSPVRIRCQIVLSLLELSVSHNRWHVMKQAGSLLDHAADNDLIDRFLIELGLNSGLRSKLERIEEVISWPRERWHPKIAAYLNQANVDNAEQ